MESWGASTLQSLPHTLPSIPPSLPLPTALSLAPTPTYLIHPTNPGPHTLNLLLLFV